MSDTNARLHAALADRYRLEEEIGAGGMATVYLAHDLRHNRKVALKVLRPDLAALIGADRFLKEIETTANLQHPHILPLHDSGEADGFLYYVMPFVEGDTLRDKLTREKQLSVDEAIDLIRGVAAALDYAHRNGVIHRDVKPENILIHDGQATVADFGIALAVRQAGGTRLTETGLSIGTPSYMSPEQAMGDRELDARSDIYSLGAMLYEMLAGEPPFVGGNAQAIVAKILTEAPPLVTKARASVPAHVAATIQKALARLPADRFSTASDFAAALVNPAFTAQVPAERGVDAPRPLWNPLSLGASALALLAITVAARAVLRPDVKPVTRVVLGFAGGEPIPAYTGAPTYDRLALSPDGSRLVYQTAGEGGPFLVVRELDQLGARPLPGTEGGGYPVISPDGERVAFLVEGSTPRIKVVSLAGGPATTVVESDVGSGPAWGSRGDLYYLDATGLGLRTVSASGGPIESLVQLAPPGDTPGSAAPTSTGVKGGLGGTGQTFGLSSGTGRYNHLRVLPGGGLLATWVPRDGRATNFGLYTIDQTSGATRLLMGGVAQGWYAVSGHLVYVTINDQDFSGTLMAAPFDPGSMAIRGRPIAITEGLDVRNRGNLDLSIANDGTLVYGALGAPATEDFVWVSRDGTVSMVDPTWTGYHEFEGLALSPDGSRLAVEMAQEGRTDIWIKQLDQGPLSRLTFDGTDNLDPSWSADGQWVSFHSVQDTLLAMWRRRADGSGPPESLFDVTGPIVTRWSSDGQWLLGLMFGREGTDIQVMQIGVDSQARSLVADRFNETTPALSPDARWLAYASDESGRSEIYIRPFPDVGSGRWQISTNGGEEPLWGPDGRELYYRSDDGQNLQVVVLSSGPSTPMHRLPIRPGVRLESNNDEVLYAVSPDGRR
ncbi:MAG TPA: LpqB family beta-propeller domain-containing protein, partial [Acidimicrobiia bacterium]